MTPEVNNGQGDLYILIWADGSRAALELAMPVAPYGVRPSSSARLKNGVGIEGRR